MVTSQSEQADMVVLYDGNRSSPVHRLASSDTSGPTTSSAEIERSRRRPPHPATSRKGQSLMAQTLAKP